MSIAFEKNSSSDHRRFAGQMAAFVPVFDSPNYAAGDRGHQEDQLSSSSTSSIGRNSDESSLSNGDGSGAAGGGGDGEEVQSEYKGGPLDSLEALEEVLPIKRGISKFYSGKSKSFTSLGDATSCPSIKDITKPENALTRKRKNLIAYNNFFNKNYQNRLKSSSGGISKRTPNARSSMSLAAMCQSESNSNSESSNSNSSSPVLALPPLPPQSRTSSNKDSHASPQLRNFTPWRSFSLSDLQGVEAATSNIAGMRGSNKEKSGKLE